MELYTWQKECLKAWEENGRRGIAHVITGAGKTVLALEAVRRFRAQYPGARIRVIVPTIPLALQWQSALLRTAINEEERPGFFGAGHKDMWDRPTMIYIINSARDSLAGHMEHSFSLNQPVLLILDECHHYQSRENRKIFDFRIPAFYPPSQYACLGLSATPFGTVHDEVLLNHIGREIYHYDFADAQADGIISSFTVLETAASFLPEERARYQTLTQELIILYAKLLKQYPFLKGLQTHVFQMELSRLALAAVSPMDPAVLFKLKSIERKQVSNLAVTRIKCAAAIIRQLPDDSRIILFCERIAQAEDMHALLRRQMGNIAVIYHSKMTREARERCLQAFRTNTARVLISCKALDEGIDVPDASTGIILSSTSVSRQRIQRLGRILRRAPGKTSASLYYIYLPESSDDMVYLPGLDDVPCVSLRYDPMQDDFSNELYEYAALEIMKNSKASLSPAQSQELRRCLLEGLARPDYLMPQAALKTQTGRTVHETNYWRAMQRVSCLFQEEGTPSPSNDSPDFSES